jgi:hypothetical protein
MKKQIGAWVEPELAHAIERLAAQGNRTVSREAAEALRRHVLLSEAPVVRRVPDDSGQSIAPAHAGSDQEGEAHGRP